MGAFQKIFGTDLDGEGREEDEKLCFERRERGESGFQKGIETGEWERVLLCLLLCLKVALDS